VPVRQIPAGAVEFGLPGPGGMRQSPNVPIIRNVALDCADPYLLALFWSKVMRQPMSDDAARGDADAVVVMPDGPKLYFQQVPEPKTVKNRMHICLEPNTPRDDEVARVMAAGAALVEDFREPDGTGWVVLADPEGNEFCVVQSAAERQ
jgi:predicted enzyme related to lactoylglutathione lyase